MFFTDIGLLLFIVQKMIIRIKGNTHLKLLGFKSVFLDSNVGTRRGLKHRQTLPGNIQHKDPVLGGPVTLHWVLEGAEADTSR